MAAFEPPGGSHGRRGLQSRAFLPDKRAYLKALAGCRTFLRRPGLSDSGKAYRKRTRGEWEARDKLPAPFRGRRRRVRRGCVREMSYPVPPDKAFDSLRSERRAGGCSVTLPPGVVLSCPGKPNFQLSPFPTPGRWERRHAAAVDRRGGNTI